MTTEAEQRIAESKRRFARNAVRRNRAAYFNGKSCVWCGSTENLELDHIDPSKKSSHRIWTWSPERRAAELAKCQVLCHDCHKEKTRQHRAAQVKCGTEWAYRKGCRCEDCRTAVSIIRRERRQRKQLNDRDRVAQLLRRKTA